MAQDLLFSPSGRVSKLSKSHIQFHEGPCLKDLRPVE
jgi:hypothetical protein